MGMQATLKMSAGLLIAILIMILLVEATGVAALSIVILFMSGLLFMMLYWIGICYLAERSEKEIRTLAQKHRESTEIIALQFEAKASILVEAFTPSDVGQGVSQIIPD